MPSCDEIGRRTGPPIKIGGEVGETDMAGWETALAPADATAGLAFPAAAPYPATPGTSHHSHIPSRREDRTFSLAPSRGGRA